MSWSTLVMLFGASFLAGLVDAIAGGGGLITVPALLAAGLPPPVALGTNKLQASFGSGSAMVYFIRSGHVRLRDYWQGVFWTALGAGIGVWAVQLLDSSLLRRIIPWLLGGIAVYLLSSPRLGEEDVHARLPAGAFYLIFGLLIGFYDGFLGPGTGSFWAMAFILVLGYSMIRATAATKVMNFTSNAMALILFLLVGQVQLQAGLLMGAGQFLGARVGARLVIRKGADFVRPVFIAMVLLVLFKLILQQH